MQIETEAIEQNTLTFDQIPAMLTRLFAKVERIENFTCNDKPDQLVPLTKYVDINGAAEITSKSPNVLRVQISLGNLKSVKKGSRRYFEREYLERWIAGEENEKGASK